MFDLFVPLLEHLNYTTLGGVCQDLFSNFLTFFEVALVRSHFKPLCVLRTICIAGGRSLAVALFRSFNLQSYVGNYAPLHHHHLLLAMR